MALKMYAIGLPFYGLYKILVPTFYALDRQKVPVLASIASIGLNISFCLTLTPLYGFKILALGTTLSVLVNSIILSIALGKYLELPLSFYFTPRLIKILIASLSSFGALQLWGMVEFFNQSIWLKALILGLEILSILFSYSLVLLILGERSAVEAIVGKFLKKIKRS
jgi:putative peptidoglycan lipid II flippase